MFAAEAHGATIGFPILTALILVPAIGGILTVLTSNRRPESTKFVALVASAVTAGLSIWMLASFETAESGFQFVSQHP